MLSVGLCSGSDAKVALGTHFPKSIHCNHACTLAAASAGRRRRPPPQGRFCCWVGAEGPKLHMAGPEALPSAMWAGGPHCTLQAGGLLLQIAAQARHSANWCLWGAGMAAPWGGGHGGAQFSISMLSTLSTTTLSASSVLLRFPDVFDILQNVL